MITRAWTFASQSGPIEEFARPPPHRPERRSRERVQNAPESPFVVDGQDDTTARFQNARYLAQGFAGILQPLHDAHHEDEVEHAIGKVELMYVAHARDDAFLETGFGRAHLRAIELGLY